MKHAIHPEQRVATMSCATCGTTFELRSSAGDLTLDTCSSCHPAYTGRPARATSGNRIERFERRLQLASL
ncbi:MAG TPA: 50S ribosomal protein L31 [Gaiellaceae bacterium]|jgi:large subunit ribosomal protein L31|nr:50S ribosomal protein L31 [Gaiellaceae bacterium]